MIPFHPLRLIVAGAAVSASLSVAGYLGYIATAAGMVVEAIDEAIPDAVHERRAEDALEQAREDESDLTRELVEREKLADDAESAYRAVRMQVERAEARLRDATTRHGPCDSLSDDQQRRLADEFDRYQRNLELLAVRKDAWDDRAEAVGATEELLAALRGRRARTEAALERVKVDRDRVGALRARTEGEAVDPAALAEAEAIVKRLRDKVEVDRRVLEYEHRIAPLPGHDPDRDIVREIDAFLASR